MNSFVKDLVCDFFSIFTVLVIFFDILLFFRLVLQKHLQLDINVYNKIVNEDLIFIIFISIITLFLHLKLIKCHKK